MLIKKRQRYSENDVTDEAYFYKRRQMMKIAAFTLGGGWLGREAWPVEDCGDLDNKVTSKLLAAKPNSYEEISSYNNYYEFSTNNKAVRILAQELTIEPWKIVIEGEVEKPITIDVDDLIRRFSNEERIYSLRCVEGWSMVIPWNGFPLCKLLNMVRPTQQAKYVEFVSLLRPEEMIGQRRRVLDWPYREGLRIDEAMHPLTFVATGLYGKPIPKQNGAPLRIAVPWKYGFKNPKAITHIRLLREQPETSWSSAAPSEYGFFANVNPNLPHPRWSQRRENRIGELKKRSTVIFNGYGEEVASLYTGMDLTKYF